MHGTKKCNQRRNQTGRDRPLNLEIWINWIHTRAEKLNAAG
jgi:hypothetical protein